MFECIVLLPSLLCLSGLYFLVFVCLVCLCNGVCLTGLCCTPLCFVWCWTLLFQWHFCLRSPLYLFFVLFVCLDFYVSEFSLSWWSQFDRTVLFYSGLYVLFYSGLLFYIGLCVLYCIAVVFLRESTVHYPLLIVFFFSLRPQFFFLFSLQESGFTPASKHFLTDLDTDVG